MDNQLPSVTRESSRLTLKSSGPLRWFSVYPDMWKWLLYLIYLEKSVLHLGIQAIWPKVLFQDLRLPWHRRACEVARDLLSHCSSFPSYTGCVSTREDSKLTFPSAVVMLFLFYPYLASFLSKKWSFFLHDTVLHHPDGCGGIWLATR